MGQTWMEVCALSLGLLIPQATFGMEAAHAQDRTESKNEARGQAKQDARAKPAADKVVKAESKASKSESTQASTDEKGAEAASNERSASAAAARRGELKERGELVTGTPVTALTPRLKLVKTPPAAPVPGAEVTDPTLIPMPPVFVVVPAPLEAAKDEALRERVQSELLKNGSLSYTGRLVRVSVQGGEITLTGQLDTQYEKLHVERAVERVRGQHVLHNQLTLRSPTPARPRSDSTAK